MFFSIKCLRMIYKYVNIDLYFFLFVFFMVNDVFVFLFLAMFLCFVY